MQREVAVKVLLPHIAASEDVLRRFEREALAAASLSHPHVLPVYDFDYDADADVWFLAMQYVPGGTTLMDCLGEPVDLPETARVVTAIGSALDAAHARGIVHRDVKPANVLLDGDRPLLTDFGIAHLGNLTGITGGGLAIGTPQYMSPEQAMGKPVGPQSDQYALAAIAYEMLAGRPPFTGDALSVMMQHVNMAPPPLTTFNPNVGPAWDAIRRAMSKDPEERFSSCEDLGRALLAASTQVGAIAPAAPTVPNAPSAAPPRLPPSVARPEPQYAGIETMGPPAAPANIPPETERAPSPFALPTVAHAPPDLSAPSEVAPPAPSPGAVPPAPPSDASAPPIASGVGPASAEAQPLPAALPAAAAAAPSVVAPRGATGANAIGSVAESAAPATRPPGTRMLLAVGATVAVVAAIVGGILVLRPGPGAGGSPTGEGESRPTTVIAGGEPALPSPPQVVPATVRVTSNPTGAGILVDGESAARTPRLLSLRPGAHDVVITAPTYRDAVRNIDVAEGQEVAVAVDLEPLSAPEVLTVSDRRLGADPYVDASGLIRLGRTTDTFRVSDDVNAVVYLEPKTVKIRDLSFTTTHRWQRAGGGDPVVLSDRQQVSKDWDETFIRACAPASALDVRGSNTPLSLQVLIDDQVVAEFSFRISGGNPADAAPSPCDATATPRTVAEQHQPEGLLGTL
jgi:serine/threonine protein kinase